MLLDTDFGVPNLDLLTELGVLQQIIEYIKIQLILNKIITYLNILLVELVVGVM